MELDWVTFASLEAHQRWIKEHQEDIQTRLGLEDAALRAWHAFGSPDGYLFPGFCPSCEAPSTFAIDREFGGRNEPGVGYVPNWRERLVCSRCDLNARVRASLALIRVLVPDRESAVWLSEQVTPLYRALAARYPHLVGSEFLGPDRVSGSFNETGLRHEDSCRSSFPDASLDAVVSFDVLEHVPDYRAALHETKRVLKAGGAFIWTAPFVTGTYETIVRAQVEPNGSVTHLMEPDYHGDPVNPTEGVLCYQYFGWDVVDLMLSVGFTDARVYQTWSMAHGLMGPAQSVFVGRA